MSNQLSRTLRQVLLSLADSPKPLTKEELHTSNKTLEALLALELIAGDGETLTFSLTETGLEALAPEKPTKDDKPEATLSRTLTRCLKLLVDGEWHTYRELNTSHQNHGRLVAKGIAIMEIGEDNVKRFQITAKGLEEFTYNRAIYNL